MEKFCLNCGIQMTRRDNESVARFSQRKYHSQDCCKDYLRKNHLGWYSAELSVFRKKAPVFDD